MAIVIWMAFASGGRPIGSLPAHIARGAGASEPSACEPSVARAAAPDRIPLGATTSVTATVAIRCEDVPLPLDIALVVDRSPSMKGAAIDAARDAARSFVERSDLVRSRIALVSFSDTGDVDAELSHDARYLRSAIDGLKTPARGGTDVAAGLRAAGRVLSGERSRPLASDVIVLLSDARNGLGDLPVRQQARILRDSGVHIITIALGISADVELMASIASTLEDAHVTADSAVLAEIFERIAGDLMSIGAREVIVLDTLADGIDAVPGSSRPPARSDGHTLEWRLGLLGAAPRSMVVDIRPDRIGRLPTSAGAEIVWTDSLGREGRAAIPIPLIEVFDPTAATATPSPSTTHIASATPFAPSTEAPPITPTVHAPPEMPTTDASGPSKHLAYLPFASSLGCSKVERRTDVMLLLDASTTMNTALPDGRTRLAAAKASASRFAGRAIDVGALVGIATFDAEARVLVAPTDARAALDGGLDAIHTRVGSRLDRGVASARTALVAMPTTGAARAIVILTDGRVVGASDGDVAEAAAMARAGGIELWAIALGADPVGIALLERMTDDPSRVVDVEGGSGLDRAFDALFTRAICR